MLILLLRAVPFFIYLSVFSFRLARTEKINSTLSEMIGVACVVYQNGEENFCQIWPIKAFLSQNYIIRENKWLAVPETELV